MENLITVFLTKLLPLYGLIGIGFVLTKYLKVDLQSLAKIVIYILMPVMFFNSTYSLDLGSKNLFLPIIFFVVSCITCFFMWALGGLFYKDSLRNLLAFAPAYGNTIYFGLPFIIAIFGDTYLSVAILISLGSTFYESTLGVFVLSRGHYSVKQSLIKLLKLPFLYAFFLGLILNFVSVPMPSFYADYVLIFKDALFVLGMMIIGCGIALNDRIDFDLKFISLNFFAKFFFFPALTFALLMLDQNMFQVFDPKYYPIFMILAVTSIAANSVSYAAEFKIHPEKMATTVFLSTLFTIFYMPIILAIFHT